ncbi:MAG: nitroreductase family protein [Candidatus Sumerlaeota bacterium]|nr:nitroreductase family protein [Candidatus Sumerlaeota bacterium]
MDFFEAIEKRFSYRGPYTDQPVPRKDLLRIVQAGCQAPSGRNLQTTSFVMVDDAALLEKIRAMHQSNKAMQQAKAFIACVVDKHPEAGGVGPYFQIEDCAVAAENMLLAATALGYASVWVDGWLRSEGRAEIIGRLLGVPEEKIVRILLPLGVPADPNPPRPKKKPVEERVWFNRFGAPAGDGGASAPPSR